MLLTLSLCAALAYVVVGGALVAQRFGAYLDEMVAGAAVRFGMCPHCLVKEHPFTITFITFWCVVPIALLWPWTIVRRDPADGGSADGGSADGGPADGDSGHS